MSLLSIVQAFAKRTNINTPTTVLGTTDPQVKQALGLLEEEGNDLASRGDWQQLTNEALHTTIAAESQGAITTIASNGFKYIKNDTIWDRDARTPIYVIDGTDWQQVKATAVTGPDYQARFRGGNLIVNPTPTAGLTWAFEYVSKNWIQDAAGANDSQYFNYDTDVPILPEELLLLGLRWRWLKEKGFEYAESFATYEREVQNALSRNQMRRVLNMSARRYTPEPKVFIPDGSWSL